MKGIFYGSTTGTTGSLAGRIAEELGIAAADVHDVAGAAADMAAHPYPKARKTAVGKAMQRMGNALDSALVTVTSMLH